MRLPTLTIVTIALTIMLTGCSTEARQSSDALPTSATAPTSTVGPSHDEAGNPDPLNPPDSASNKLLAPDPKTFVRSQDFYLETPRGAKMFLRTPGPPIAELEVLRNSLRIKPVSYLVARVDNSWGSAEANLESVTIYDVAGNAYRFTPVTSGHITEWGPFVSGEELVLSDGTSLNKEQYQSLKDQAGDLESELAVGIDPGSQGNLWLLSRSTNLPDEVTRVMVKAQGTHGFIHAFPRGVQGYSLE